MSLSSNYFRKLLLLPLLSIVLIFTLSACDNNEQKGKPTISSELKSMQVNLATLTKQKKEVYFDNLNQMLEKQKKEIQQVKNTAQQKLEREYNKAYEQYEDMKEAGEAKQQEMYDKTVDALARLNQMIKEAAQQ